MKTKTQCKTFSDIYALTTCGTPVYWKNDGYQVVYYGHRYFVAFLRNGSCVGLYEPDYNPTDFYFYITEA